MVAPADPSNPTGGSLVDSIYDVYLKALLAGKRAACLAMVQELIQEEVSLKTIYLDLFQRSLYQVGELWERNRVSVAVEHMATAITENAMGLLHPIIFAAEHCGRKTIVSCAANEFHQIGGKMVADFFEFHGWDGYFLGANTPVRDLLGLVQEQNPDLLCLSLTIQANLPNLIRHIETARASFSRLDILVGGQAFRWGGREAAERFPAVAYVESLDRLEEIIRGST